MSRKLPCIAYLFHEMKTTQAKGSTIRLRWKIARYNFATNCCDYEQKDAQLAPPYLPPSNFVGNAFWIEKDFLQQNWIFCYLKNFVEIKTFFSKFQRTIIFWFWKGALKKNDYFGSILQQSCCNLVPKNFQSQKSCNLPESRN